MFDTIVLTETTAKVAGVDERLLADDELLAGVCVIEAARRYLDAAEGAMLAELDARGTTDVVSGLRTAQWLARETGVAPGTAHLRVTTAKVLRADLPGTDAAVREGRLPLDRARVMAGAVNERIVDEFRVMEESLIAESPRMTFREWSQRVRLVAALLDQDGAQPDVGVEANRLNLRPGAEGVHLDGVLVGDWAVTTRHAIEQMADEIFRRYERDAEVTQGEVTVPKRQVLRALALAELCRRGLMVDVHGAAVRVPRTEATLVINLDTPDLVYVDDMPLIRFSDTALACDPDVRAIVMSSLGVPLDMGREIRTANAAQRRALKRRDGGCAFPGCDMRPEHCDAHHVAHWIRDHGATDVRCMVFLCRHHHGVVHRRGWAIDIGDDGWCRLTMPSGAEMWCQRHGEQRAGPPPPLAA
ncbi:MAG: DUF222 domain-containing protein [Acidimicrobiales bacterium]